MVKRPLRWSAAKILMSIRSRAGGRFGAMTISWWRIPATSLAGKRPLLIDAAAGIGADLPRRHARATSRMHAIDRAVLEILPGRPRRRHRRSGRGAHARHDHAGRGRRAHRLGLDDARRSAERRYG